MDTVQDYSQSEAQLCSCRVRVALGSSQTPTSHSARLRIGSGLGTSSSRAHSDDTRMKRAAAGHPSVCKLHSDGSIAQLNNHRNIITRGNCNKALGDGEHT